MSGLSILGIMDWQTIGRKRLDAEKRTVVA
jgi:hypothetical protein